MFRVRILGQRITALDHEILDDPVETRAIVESLLRQGLEVLDGFGGDVRPKLNDHVARRGADDGYFAHTCKQVGLSLAGYLMVSAGTILMLMTPWRSFGRSCGCVGVVAIFSSTSSPLISLPNAVY